MDEYPYIIEETKPVLRTFLEWFKEIDECGVRWGQSDNPSEAKYKVTTTLVETSQTTTYIRSEKHNA